MKIFKQNNSITTFRNGWQRGCAKRMSLTERTIYTIIRSNGAHPRYNEMMKIAEESFKI